MRRIIIGLTLLLVVVVLGVGQLVLPGLAASSLRSRLGRSGRVLSVRVSAFPAIELLWHHASSVTVRMASYQSSGARQIESLLDEAGGVGTLTASTERLDTGVVPLTNASLTKHGDRLSGHADLSSAALRAIPLARVVDGSLSFVRSGAGTVTLEGRGSFFGLFSARVPVTVHAVDGRLVATAAGLLSFPIYSSPHVQVIGVSGAATPSGMALSATGTYR